MNALRLVAPLSPSILHLRSSAGLYGADQMLLTLNGALADSGARSCLISINNYLMREQPLHEAATNLGQHAELLRCRGRFDPRSVSALSARVNSTDLPVVHAHDYKSAFYAWISSRHTRTPLVATLHGQVQTSHTLRMYSRVEMAILRRFDAVVVVANGQIDSLLRAGIDRRRVHQIDNAIAYPPSVPVRTPGLRQAFGLDEEGYVFGAVGRLSPEKNLSMLINTFGRLAAVNPNAALAIVGDGPERGALHAQAEQLGIGPRVHFLGERNDMDRIYSMLDCLVLPSLSEGMPLVVLEAMARAMPVIASAVGDVPRLLSHSTYGQLVKPGDARSLHEALVAAVGAPERHDEAARTFVRQHHSPAVMAERYLDIYRSLQVHGHGRQSA